MHVKCSLDNFFVNEFTGLQITRNHLGRTGQSW